MTHILNDLTHEIQGQPHKKEVSWVQFEVFIFRFGNQVVNLKRGKFGIPKMYLVKSNLSNETGPLVSPWLFRVYIYIYRGL